MRFCNAAGAIVASQLSCADAMPTAIRLSASWRRRHVSDERFRALIEARVEPHRGAVAEAAPQPQAGRRCSASTAS